MAEPLGQVVDEINGDVDAPVKEEIVDDDVTQEDGDEEKSKSDDKNQKKNNARPFIPSRLEYRQDRLREQQERTVIVGPATLDDLVNLRLIGCIKTSQQFFIRFFKEKPERKATNGAETNGDGDAAAATPAVTPAAPEEEGEEEYKGHVEIRFASIDEAEQCVKDLNDLREGLTVKRITYEYTKNEEYKDLRKITSQHRPQDVEGITGSRAGRIVAITKIEPPLTRDDVKEAIPDALEVMLPKNYETNENKGYAYVEVATSDRAKALAGSHISLGDKKRKVYALEEIPSTDEVIRRIDKERVSEPFMRALEATKKERLRTLLRHAVHYQAIEETPQNKQDALKKRIDNIRKRLREDTRNAREEAGHARAARGRGRVVWRPTRGGSAYGMHARRGLLSHPPVSSGYRGGMRPTSAPTYGNYYGYQQQQQQYNNRFDNRPNYNNYYGGGGAAGGGGSYADDGYYGGNAGYHDNYNNTGYGGAARRSERRW